MHHRILSRAQTKGQAVLLCAAFLVLALGASLAVGALGDALSILGLGSATAVGLSGRHPILIFLGGRRFARIRVNGSCTLTIAANCFTACVFHAIFRKQA
jgi:hypothetical protein